VSNADAGQYLANEGYTDAGRLVAEGLVIARHEAGGRTLHVVRVKITDASDPGLHALPPVVKRGETP
jgi:hypothetical protein